MLEYWLWLTGRRGVGLRGLRALLEQFGTPEAVYCAAEQDYPQALLPEEHPCSDVSGRRLSEPAQKS